MRHDAENPRRAHLGMISALKNFLLSIAYARRELRSGIKGFYIFLACLVLGVAAIASVQSLSRGMIDSLRYDGRYILGGDISLRTVYAPAPPEQVKWLKRALGPVTIVMETRAMARAADNSTAALVELKAVDPFYPLYGELVVTDGTGKRLTEKAGKREKEGGTLQDLLLSPVDDNGEDLGQWGVVVEKELLSRLRLGIGDDVYVGRQKFQIRGIIEKEPDRLGSTQFSIAPRVMMSSYVFDKTGLAEEGSQVYYSHRVISPYGRTPADMDALVERITAQFPEATWRGRHAFNASPRLERMIDKLTMFLTLIGLATLLVGGVGISNAIRSFLESRLSHIATFKCLGASSGFVFRVYMAQILFLALLGIALGLGLGILLSQMSGGFLTEKLSLSNKVGIYPEALLLAGGFGILTTFCFSLWPLGRALNTPPADLFRDLILPSEKKPSVNIMLWTLIVSQLLALLAVTSATDTRLALWFAGGTFAAFGIFILYAEAIKLFFRKIRLPAAPEWRMALSNLYRPGNVTGSIILSLGLGLTVLVATGMVQNNFSRLLSNNISKETPSFFFLDIQPNQKEDFMATVARAGGKDLVITPSFRGRVTTVNGIPAEEALVDKNENWVIRSDRGFTWMRDIPASSTLVEGAWWEADYSGPPIVSIATNVARAFDIGAGDEISVNVLGLDIAAKVANVREIEWSSFAMNFAITFAPGVLDKAPANYLGTVILPAEKEEALQTTLATQFPNVTSVRVKDALDAAQTVLRAIAQAVSISAAVTLVAGTLVLAGGIAAARRRHIYDAVILKVLGATRNRILKTFLLEYGILGALTVIIAAGLGTLAAYGLMLYLMDIPWHFSLSALLGVTALCLSITLSAGFFGTWRALRQKPAGYLRNQ